MRKLALGLLLAVLAAISVAGAAMVLAILQSTRASGPEYTVAQLQAAVDRPNSGLDGRTIRVRGYVWHWGVTVDGVGPEYFSLTDTPDAPGTDPQIFVSLGTQDRWLADLRRVPGLGSLLPPPQRIVIGKPAIYRLTLSLVTDLAVCTPRRPCVRAALRDAEPLDFTILYRP